MKVPSRYELKQFAWHNHSVMNAQPACGYFSSRRKQQTHLGHHPTGKKHIGQEKFLKESKLVEIQFLQQFRLVDYKTQGEIQATESKQ